MSLFEWFRRLFQPDRGVAGRRLREAAEADRIRRRMEPEVRPTPEEVEAAVETDPLGDADGAVADAAPDPYAGFEPVSHEAAVSADDIEAHRLAAEEAMKAGGPVLVEVGRDKAGKVAVKRVRPAPPPTLTDVEEGRATPDEFVEKKPTRRSRAAVTEGAEKKQRVRKKKET